MSALSAYRYPGNVRELAHAVESAAILSGPAEWIELGYLPESIRAVEAAAAHGLLSGISEDLQLPEAMQTFERAFLAEALSRHPGTRSDLARRLGISRKNLWEKLKAHGLA